MRSRARLPCVAASPLPADPDFSFCSTSWGFLPRPPNYAATLPRCPAAPFLGAQIVGGHGGFLPPDALRRGIASYGSGARMERLGHKLLQGQPLTVAFLGGSITWGRVSRVDS